MNSNLLQSDLVLASRNPFNIQTMKKKEQQRSHGDAGWVSAAIHVSHQFQQVQDHVRCFHRKR